MRAHWALLIAAVTVVCAAGPALGAYVTGVPMQGSMIDVGIGYVGGKLVWQWPPDSIAHLTTLAESNAGFTFNPADPWYTPLQGKAFSRRFSFNLGDGDNLPAGATLWLEKVGGTTGLDAYFYKPSSPKSFTPVFGTGSSSTLYTAWNLNMWHPAFAIDAQVSNSIHADFKAYLVDSGGNIITSATSDIGVFNFTATPEPATLGALAAMGVALLKRRRRSRT